MSNEITLAELVKDFMYYDDFMVMNKVASMNEQAMQNFARKYNLPEATKVAIYNEVVRQAKSFNEQGR